MAIFFKNLALCRKKNFGTAQLHQTGSSLFQIPGGGLQPGGWLDPLPRAVGEGKPWPTPARRCGRRPARGSTTAAAPHAPVCGARGPPPETTRRAWEARLQGGNRFSGGGEGLFVHRWHPHQCSDRPSYDRWLLFSTAVVRAISYCVLG